MNSTTKVHKCQFSGWRPAEITSMSYNTENRCLAVGHIDGSIDLWSMENQFFYQTSFGGSKYDDKVVKLMWINLENKNILVTVSEYKINLWDYDTFTLLNSLNTENGAIKTASYNSKKKLLVTATTDSMVQLYKFKESKKSFKYYKSFSKIASGSLPTSIEWCPDHKHIVCGTDSDLNYFNIENMELENSVHLANITAIRILDQDGTVACGHSTGFISIVEVKFGSVLQEFRNLHAAVRCIKVCNNDTFYASGDDPTLVLFSKKDDKWFSNGLHRRHTHDVRDIEIINDFLVTGGVSGQLIFFDHLTFTKLKTKTLKHNPYPLNRNYAITLESNPILLIESVRNTIHLWSLGNADIPQIDLPNGCFLPPSKNVKKILQFESKQSQFIESIDISRNGKYFAYSTSTKAMLYRIDGGGETTTNYSIKSIKLPEIEAGSIKFTADSNHLIIASKANQISIYNIETSSVNIIKNNNILTTSNKSNEIAKVLNMELSGDGQFLAIFDSLNIVSIFNIKTQLILVSLLIHFPSKMSFCNRNDKLVIVTPYDYIVYDPIKKKTNFKKQSPRSPIIAITRNPNNIEESILWSQDGIAMAPLNNENMDYRYQTYFNSVIYAQSTLSNDMVVLELPYDQQILPTLPPAIKLKKFGEI
eukprot:gene549-693_t